MLQLVHLHGIDRMKAACFQFVFGRRNSAASLVEPSMARLGTEDPHLWAELAAAATDKNEEGGVHIQYHNENKTKFLLEMNIQLYIQRNYTHTKDVLPRRCHFCVLNNHRHR